MDRRSKMRYSVVKVSKVYQDARAICREHPECKSWDEAKVYKSLDRSPDWDLTAKEDKALRRICNWLGI